MPRAAICRVERPYADLGMTILLSDSTPDVNGASGWKPMPIEAVHGAAGMLLVRDKLLLCPEQDCWPGNLALRLCVLQVLQANRCATPLPEAVVSIAEQHNMPQKAWQSTGMRWLEGTPSNLLCCYFAQRA